MNYVLYYFFAVTRDWCRTETMARLLVLGRVGEILA